MEMHLKLTDFLFSQHHKTAAADSILKLLYDTCRERNVTVIVITHNLALTAMGDKVIKVKNGLISEIEINENPIPVERIEW